VVDEAKPMVKKPFRKFSDDRKGFDRGFGRKRF